MNTTIDIEMCQKAIARLRKRKEEISRQIGRLNYEIEMAQAHMRNASSNSGKELVAVAVLLNGKTLNQAGAIVGITGPAAGKRVQSFCKMANPDVWIDGCKGGNLQTPKLSYLIKNAHKFF